MMGSFLSGVNYYSYTIGVRGIIGRGKNYLMDGVKFSYMSESFQSIVQYLFNVETLTIEIKILCYL